MRTIKFIKKTFKKEMNSWSWDLTTQDIKERLQFLTGIQANEYYKISTTATQFMHGHYPP